MHIHAVAVNRISISEIGATKATVTVECTETSSQIQPIVVPIVTINADTTNRQEKIVRCGSTEKSVDFTQLMPSTHYNISAVVVLQDKTCLLHNETFKTEAEEIQSQGLIALAISLGLVSNLIVCICYCNIIIIVGSLHMRRAEKRRTTCNLVLPRGGSRVPNVVKHNVVQKVHPETYKVDLSSRPTTAIAHASFSNLKVTTV